MKLLAIVLAVTAVHGALLWRRGRAPVAFAPRMRGAVEVVRGPSPARGSKSRSVAQVPAAAPVQVPAPNTTTTAGTVTRSEVSAEQVVAWGNALPEYPEEARRREWEGEVTLDFDGGGVTVGESSGHALLDRAALDAAKSWHFPDTVPRRVRLSFVLR